MKQKRDIKTRHITKYKVRLNVHGGQQQCGINYFDTYVLVVTWTSVKLILVVAILNAWAIRQSADARWVKGNPCVETPQE
eukprot:10287401-Ditylum_brightwellii.AAC.1